MAYWTDLSYYKDTFKGVDVGEDFAVSLIVPKMFLTF